MVDLALADRARDFQDLAACQYKAVARLARQGAEPETIHDAQEQLSALAAEALYNLLRLLEAA